MNTSTSPTAGAARLAVGWTEIVGSSPSTVRHGTLAKADLSGFTRLSERLAQGVQGGAEELSESIDATFARLIEPALQRGGDVLQFAGDALVLWFEGEGHEARAAATCWDFQRVIRDHGRIETPLGAVRLRVSIGAASGDVGFAIIGETHRELIAFGPTATEALSLESRATAGQVLLSPITASVLPAPCRSEFGGAFRLRRAVEAPAPTSEPVESGLDSDPFIPAELRRGGLNEGSWESGEHRTVAVAFLLLPGTDRRFLAGGPEAVWNAAGRVASAIDRAVLDLGVCWSATDLAEDGIVFLLYTGVPIAKGDDDERLLRAIRQILETVDDLSLRAGAHRGRIFSGRIGHPQRRTWAFLGDTVNLAARLMGKAPAGKAVVSRTIIEHSRARFATTDLAPFAVKGKRALIDACLLGALTSAGRSATTETRNVVGREVEQRRLATAWQQALAGRGGVIGLVGEPGIGKSALVADLVSSIGGVTTMVARCDPYEASAPYWAVRGELRRLTGVGDAAGLLHWISALDGIDGDAEQVAALTAPSFGIELPSTEALDLLDPAIVQDRRHDAVARVLVAAFPGPLLLIAEDVHWADEASYALLTRLAVEASRNRWLVLMTSRHEGNPFPDSGIEQIELQPLAESDLHALAQSMAADGDLLDRDLARLVERSGGNPLFLAELVATGHREDLPDSIEQLLATRIDTLAPPDRALLRELSVLGNVVSLEVAARVLERPEIREAGPWQAIDPFVHLDDDQVRFRHDLMRAAAYDGLAKRRRRLLHGRAADTLDGSAEDSTVAMHLLNAERWSDAWPLAARAAAAARQQGALADASDLYAKAAGAARRSLPVQVEVVSGLDVEHADVLELLGRLPEAEKVLRGAARLGLATPLGRARLARQTARVQRRTGHFASSLAWVTRGLQMVELLPPGRERERIAADLLLLRSSIRRLQGLPARAKEWAEEGLAIAKRLDDPTLQGTAHIHLEAISQELGLPERAHHEAEAIRLLTAAAADGLLGTILMNSAFARHESGEWSEALELLSGAAASFQRVGQGVDEALCESTTGMILLLQGRYGAARSGLAASARISRAIGWEQGRGYSGYGLAFLDALDGDVASANARFDDAEQIFLRDHVMPFVHEVRRWRAEALIRSGAAAEALVILDALADDSTRMADPPLDLAVLRLRGHALAMLDRVDEAVVALDLALARSHEIGFPYEIAMSQWARKALADGPAEATQSETSDEVRARLADLGVTDAVTLPPLSQG